MPSDTPTANRQVPPATGHDPVNHPRHYAALPGVDFECIDVTREMTFSSGDVVKYMWRFPEKNGRQDVAKAQWYLKDALAHGDPVFIRDAEHPARIQAAKRLKQVAAAMAEPELARFYDAMSTCALTVALGAVDALLARIPS